MKKLNQSLLVLAIGSLCYACTNNSNKNTVAVETRTDSLSSYDSATTVHNAADTASNPLVTFALKAAAGGKMEVELGTVAQEVSDNPRVKAFGAMMVKDHSKANQELMTLAELKGIRLPSTMPEEMQHHINDIKFLKGKEFDTKYMAMMVDDHKDDVNLFEDASKTSKDADIKAFASKTLPILKMHLDSAKSVKGSIK
ncbi:DUF4142 domain-containing protein [Pedobacter deserti]|uniref:DUF4142 domain-containing protein n=1 Tax=Pedobacter deserti TaxID=2817382 RepID=UPI00210F219B|nr:DUF4142 domain-containing protein [Pedobacter sp. SYSU D00382]